MPAQPQSDPPATERSESDDRFPSGPWVGFWIQKPVLGRQWMQNLWLRFVDGKVTGGGSDCIGAFVFDGHYDLKTGNCDLVKTYLGAHKVLYQGRNENDGLWLWGTWNIRHNDRGGFHLWPKGELDPTQRRLKQSKPIPKKRELVTSDA
jgi:hypothetical protein